MAARRRRATSAKHPVTMSRALVDLAHRRFIDENDPARKDQAGRELIRAIFGKNAIAEDLIL